MYELKHILRFLLTVAKCGFICPFELPRSSAWHKVNATMMLVLPTIWLCNYLTIFIRNFFMSPSRIVLVITHINMFMAVGALEAIWCDAFAHRERYVDILRELRAIDLASRYTNYTDARRHVKLWIIFLVYLGIATTSNVVMSVVIEAIQPVELTWKTLQFHVVYDIPILVIYSFAGLYIGFVRAAGDRFAMIVATVEKLRPETNTAMMVTQLGRTARLHQRVCDVCDELNRTMSVSVFAIIAVYLLQLITNAYSIAIIVMCANGRSSGLVMIAFTVIQVMPALIILVYLSYQCEKAAKQAESSGDSIHMIDVNDEELRDVVQIFSMQIKHASIEFTAGGFFAINHRMLFVIAGALTTYLIILIQFTDTREDTCAAMGIVAETPLKNITNNF